ncbi:hypothetical protein DL765_007999 [Monosporascus sp. GIB2]|nr:hypothetical protein DL765_007999 [Monosporascus sp. GIB2]
MSSLKPYPMLLGLAMLLIFVRPALAFGAGNIASISRVEGQNWRHGDLEDTLLAIMMARAAGGKKFDKLNVSRVYFGNWLRDYSQAIDVGTVKAVSAEAIRLLICVLGFLTFGYGSKEFEVTTERLGCYRPEEHIDNPKNYADNEDARQYHERLRGPIDEEIELAIDRETGMKNYIANERVGIMTSAKLVRKLFRRCIELGREYNNSRNKQDLYEALRLLGTGLHCLEDFLAHSNYTELALIELGERDVFPHVGRDTLMAIPGARDEVYPCVTGTFGGVDFLHSVTGEVSDKITQSELDNLEGTLQSYSKDDTSIIEGLLDKIPDGLLGGGDKKQQMHEIQDNAHNAQMENASISPRDPEEFTLYIQNVFRQIMPAIEFHDQLMQNISQAIDKIPILPQIIAQLEEQLSMWVFAIMAPFVTPILQQVKNELRTGSSEVIESSKNEQHIVFEDDRSTDPTHSMLSKDHFSNILNEPAGRTASKVVAWVVPQIMAAWDDEGIDIKRTNDRIISGVMHHPAQRHMGEDGADECRDIMFRSVGEWWNGLSENTKDEYRQKLSRRGVEQGENHKEGVHDTGHGCGKPLGMRKNFAEGGSLEDRIAGAAAGAIMEGLTGGISNFVEGQSGGAVKLPDYKNPSQRYDREEESGGGGGGGGFFEKVAGSLLGGAFKEDERESRSSRRVEGDGSYTESRTEYGRSGDRYGQADYSETHHGGGGHSSEYRRFEQGDGGQGGYRYEERSETYSGGRYEERSETRYESTTERYEQSSGRDRRGGDYEDSYGKRDDYGSGYSRDDSYGQRDEYGSRQNYGGNEDREEGSGYRGSGGYGRDEYREEGSGYRGSGGYGRDEYREEGSDYHGSGGYGRDEYRPDDEEQRRPGWGY